MKVVKTYQGCTYKKLWNSSMIADVICNDGVIVIFSKDDDKYIVIDDDDKISSIKELEDYKIDFHDQVLDCLDLISLDLSCEDTISLIEAVNTALENKRLAIVKEIEILKEIYGQEK